MSARRQLRASCAALVFTTFSFGAFAQSYPAHAITLTVPFPPGGPTDTIGRIVAEGMRNAIGQPVVVKNVAGATGSIATGQVARAAPDGYTIVLGTIATHVFNGAAYRLDHDLVKDFAPVSLVAFDPQIVSVRKCLPVSNLGELISWLKAHPDDAVAGTAGVGSTAHIGAIRFQQLTGTTFRFVPYGGLGPAMQELIAGRIDIVFGLAGNTTAHVESGTIKALAVTAKSRLVDAPDIPTVAEAGLSEFQFINWHAIFAPRGTPDVVLKRLNDVIVRALTDAPTVKRLSAIGQQLPARDQLTPQALAEYQRNEIDTWWPVIKSTSVHQ